LSAFATRPAATGFCRMYSSVASSCSSFSIGFEAKRLPKTWSQRRWRALKARAYSPFRSRMPAERFASRVSTTRW
jgi:hypothetical protein